MHCALPGASCGQQMISVDFQSAPIITGEATLPLRWLRQLPLCGLAAQNLLALPAILSLASFEILAEILPDILEMWYIQKYLKLPIDPHGTSWVRVDISRTGGRQL